MFFVIPQSTFSFNIKGRKKKNLRLVYNKHEDMMSARGSEISPATWRTLQSGFEHGLEFILPNMNADDKSLVAHQWPLNHASPMDSAHESFINDFSGIVNNGLCENESGILACQVLCGNFLL